MRNLFLLAIACLLCSSTARADDSTLPVAGRDQRSPEIGTGPRSPGLMVGGGVLGGVGLSAVVAGTTMAVAAAGECPDRDAAGASCDRFDSGMREAMGVMIAAAGGAAILGGTIMVILGARPEKRSARMEPTVHVGAGSARLDWQF